MADRIRVDDSQSIPDGQSKVYEFSGRSVAVFHVGGRYFAIDSRCPHRGASLSEGPLNQGVVTCPLHGWQFELATGRCADRPGVFVTKYSAFVAGDDLFVEFPSNGDDPGGNGQGDGIFRYLVRYGSMGWVEQFGSVEPVACRRGDQVIAQTSRGLELAEVLSPPTQDGTDRPTGEVLRQPTEADRQQVQEASDRTTALFDAGRRALAQRELDVDFVDGEVLLDGQTAVFYFLGNAPPELVDFAEEFGQSQNIRVQVEPLADSEMPVPSGGGCGMGGCGCHADG